MVPNEQHAFEPRLPCCGGGQAAAALAPASTSPLRLSVTEPVAHTLSSVTANFLPALDLLPLYSAVPAYGGAPSLALPTGLRMLAPFLGCSECQDAIKSETGAQTVWRRPLFARACDVVLLLQACQSYPLTLKRAAWLPTLPLDRLSTSSLPLHSSVTRAP